MNNIKIIRNQKDYDEALNLIEGLMGRSPDPGSTEGEQLDLLVALVRDYESRVFPINLPDPVEAIKFKMEQRSLKPVDLIPYIGSKGRVSEILSGKRQLTLEMVRALESGLGIPAKVLIQQPRQSIESQYQNWDTQLVKAMEQRGYFGDKSLKIFNRTQLITDFFATLGNNLQPMALFRKTNYRIAPRTDKNALAAWMVRVLDRANKIKTPVKYNHGVVNLAFMQSLIRLSANENGPILAQEYLKKHGIKLVIEPHLPKTHLDGAAILTQRNNPIIGLTIRRDRLGNFWFTLMHELAHLALHFKEDTELFYDEKLQDKDGGEVDVKEHQADILAGEAILPENVWEISNAKITPTAMATQSLANELGVHVAVVAGVIQHRHHNFYYLNKIVNDDSARVAKYFSSIFKTKV